MALVRGSKVPGQLSVTMGGRMSVLTEEKDATVISPMLVLHFGHRDFK